MKIESIKDKETNRWVLPGQSINLDEFNAGIKKAEECPFYTMGESKKIIEGWRRKRNSR